MHTDAKEETMMKRWPPFSVLFGLLVLFPSVMLAQNYPTKPITLVVPFGAGAPSDAVARFLAEP